MLTTPRWEAECRLMSNNFPTFEPFAVPSGSRIPRLPGWSANGSFLRSHHQSFSTGISGQGTRNLYYSASGIAPLDS